MKILIGFRSPLEDLGQKKAMKNNQYEEKKAARKAAFSFQQVN